MSDGDDKYILMIVSRTERIYVDNMCAVRVSNENQNNVVGRTLFVSMPVGTYSVYMLRGGGGGGVRDKIIMRSGEVQHAASGPERIILYYYYDLTTAITVLLCLYKPVSARVY